MEDRYPTLTAMEHYGGGFVKALARAWYAADGDNKKRLETAFKDYFEKYAAMSRRETREEEDK